MLLPLLAAVLIGQSPVPPAPTLAEVQAALTEARTQIQKDNVAIQILQVQRNAALDAEVARFIDTLVPKPASPPTQPPKEPKQ